MSVQMYRKLSCKKVNGEAFEEVLHEVVEETPLALFVNGRHAMTAMVSPIDIEDFILGFLFTEQVIKSADDIESIKVDKNRVSVITKNLFKVLGPKKTILSGCGGSVSYIDTEKLPKIDSDFTISVTTIKNLLKDAFNSELHKMTGGTHFVALADREKILTVSEDIGRHNALDRIIGFGLRTGIDFSHTFVIASGRISSEMARKCLIANIPIIVSRGATTTLAVDIAEKTGLTIVGFARGAKMNIYTNSFRIEGVARK